MVETSVCIPVKSCSLAILRKSMHWSYAVRKLSMNINYGNPGSLSGFSFADGAAAAVLEKNHEHNRLLAYASVTDGSLVDHVKIPHGGTRSPPSENPPDEKDYCLCVDDPEGLDQIFSHIYLKNYLYIINEALRKSGYSSGDIDYLFMNQVKQEPDPEYHGRPWS